MSLENDLFSALKSLVGNRVSPDEFPQPPAVPTWPAIRYTFIDWVSVGSICGDGTDETGTPRVQLDIVATTRTAASALRLQVIAVMKTFDPPARLEDRGRSERDAETKTYRWILDYTFHASTITGQS